jgi:hypothetical protein
LPAGDQAVRPPVRPQEEPQTCRHCENTKDFINQDTRVKSLLAEHFGIHHRLKLVLLASGQKNANNVLNYAAKKRGDWFFSILTTLFATPEFLSGF